MNVKKPVEIFLTGLNIFKFYVKFPDFEKPICIKQVGKCLGNFSPKKSTIEPCITGYARHENGAFFPLAEHVH